MNQNQLLAVDEDILDQVAGGGGECLNPCELIEGAVGAVGGVVEGVIDAKKQLIECGVKTIESLFCHPGK